MHLAKELINTLLDTNMCMGRDKSFWIVCHFHICPTNLVLLTGPLKHALLLLLFFLQKNGYVQRDVRLIAIQPPGT